MNKIVRISDCCPETGKIETVSVTFAEIRMTGARTPGQKVLGYSCTHASEHGCSSNGADGMLCPLYRRAILKRA